MITTHVVNHTESKQVFKQLGDLLQKKECYSNVFHSIHLFSKKFTSGEWKVAYGYLRIFEGEPLMARHCFIVSQDGEAIDPTLIGISTYQEGQVKEHVAFHIFDDLNVYLDAVTENNNVPDLIKPFWDKENSISEKWARKNGCLLIR